MSAPPRHQETRTILSISLPLMTAYVAEMGMVITDMIIVGRLGSNELAAVGLAGDWFYVLMLIGMGVISIVGVLAAQSLGAGNRDGITDAGEQGMIAATISGIPVMLSIWYLGPMLGLARQDAEVVRLITDYSRPLTLGVLPGLWFAVLRNYITALAKSSAIMTITVAALMINLALNYTLVYGKLGFPALGVVGAGYGTAIVNWLIFFALAAHVLKSRHFRKYRMSIIPDRVNGPTLLEIFSLGLPVTATQLLNGAMFTVAAVLIGMISADILAAQQIVYSVIYLALSASIALGDAVKVRVAYGIGMRSIDAARQSAHISFLLAAVAIVFASGFLWIFPELVVSIFLDTADTANTGVLLIAVGLSIYAGLFQLFDGVLIVAANALRGLRDTRSPLWISMLGYWAVGIGIGTYLCFPMGYGEVGLWWGLIFGVIFSNVLMFRQFYRRLQHAATTLAELPIDRDS
jgi:MATE family multidrug resistance protein